MIEIKTEALKNENNSNKKGLYATGKRKNSIARVWLKTSGSGKILVNKKNIDVYFKRSFLNMIIKQPLEVLKNNNLDVIASVTGGGLSGQAGAIKLAISRALITFDSQLRPSLKSKGFLTRDSRVVERKKYGRRKARRSFQFSKR